MIIEDIPEGAELRYDTVADSLARIFINLRFDDVKPYRADLFSEPGETSVTTSSGELRRCSKRYLLIRKFTFARTAPRIALRRRLSSRR